VLGAVIFLEEFSNNSQGWTFDSNSPTVWEIGAATASGSSSSGFNPDPALDHSPGIENGVAGVVIGGNAPTSSVHPFKYITSPQINVSGIEGNVTLEYYRWLNSDYTPFMKNVIDVYDGSVWNRIWETGGSPGIADSEWTLQTFDITNIVDSISSDPFASVQLRFGYDINSLNAISVSSWNIDDVKVFNDVSPVPKPTSLALLGLALAGLRFQRRKAA